MSHHQGSRSDPPPPRNGLISELEKLKRGRGSSATPRPSNASVVSIPGSQGAKNQSLSPAGIQSDPINRQQGHLTQHHETSPSPAEGAGSRTTTSTRGGIPPLRSSRGSSRDVGTFKFPAFEIAESNSIADFATSLRDHLDGLKETVQRINSLTKTDQEQLVNSIDNVGKGFGGQALSLQATYSNLSNERDRLRSQLEQVEARELATLADRDQARSQVIKRQQSFERLRKAEVELKKKNIELLKHIQSYEDQTQGVRFSAKEPRRNLATPYDPFTTPPIVSGPFNHNNKPLYHGLLGSLGLSGSPALGGSSAWTKSFGGGESSHGSLMMPSIGGLSINEQTPNAPKHARADALPFGPASTQSVISVTQESILESLRNPLQNTEPPSPAKASLPSAYATTASQALKLDPTAIYAEKFKEVYTMAERWCLHYASLPNAEVDSRLSETHPDLWAYMMRCTYPRNPKDAQAHIVALLQDSKCRFLLCVRLILTYCVREIMVPDEFRFFNQDVSQALYAFKSGLSERGLANNVRQSIIEQQTKVIEKIIHDSGFSNFRGTRLVKHAATLRNMLGPLLNRSAIRSDAGKDLGDLSAKAWDASVVLNTSNLTFQMVFPETHSKFLAATMIARDRPDKDPLTLQQSQLRLKLAITPLTTLRNDGGTSIQAKELHKAIVLTMV